MTQEEFERTCPVFPSFPNYTKEMWEGNTPNCKGHEMLDGGFSDKWTCCYGGGETYKGKLLHAAFSVNRKTTIYIVGDRLSIVYLPDGVVDVYEYTNKPEMFGLGHNPSVMHHLESEFIEKTLNNNKRDCKLWRLVQARAKELYEEAKK